jgi:RimJ/RimL family protein N-acetyltransferase
MEFPLQPTLSNDWVALRPLNETDFDALFAVASDPLIWEQHPNFDRYQEPVFKAFFRDALNSRGAFLIVDRKTNSVIGSTRYQLSASSDRAVEIGWTFLARTYWGGHYNGAIKALMLIHAFKFVPEVVFHIGRNNFRSQRAVEKLGAYQVSGDEHAALLSDNPENLTFLITKATWRKQPSE